MGAPGDVRWLCVRFDGGSLAFARLTRRYPGVVVHLVAGRAQGPERVFPTAARVRGLNRTQRGVVRVLLERQYRRRVATYVDEGDLVVAVGIPRRLLATSVLDRLAGLDDGFDMRCARIEQGMVTFWARGETRSVDAALEEIRRDVPIAVAQVATPDDLTPWLGLEPQDPPGQPLEHRAAPTPKKEATAPGPDDTPHGGEGPGTWLEARFPGEGVLAGLTRVFSGAQVRLAVERPDAHGHPASLEVEGVPPLLVGYVARRVAARCPGHIDETTTGVVGFVHLPFDELGPMLRAAAHFWRDGPAHVLVVHDEVRVQVLGDEAMLARARETLAAAGVEVQVVREPWRHLDVMV